MVGLLGILVFTAIAWLLSNNRKAISPRIVFWGFALQIIFAVLVLGIPALGISGVLKFLFDWMNSVVVQILAYSDAGARFVFGPLMDESKTSCF